MKTIIYNGNVITRTGIRERGGIVLRDGLIESVFTRQPALSVSDRLIDAEGLYISPGWIDAHVHGGGGADVMDGTAEAVAHIARTHIAYGMTAFLPTTLTAAPERIAAACEAVRAARDTHAAEDGARILGIHLEGPFLSMRYKGAQNPAYLQMPTVENYLALTGGAMDIRRVSMAPELPGAFALAQYLSQKGVLVSVAHSEADYDVMRQAAAYGFRHVTHMWNGMSGLSSPDFYAKSGVAESALELDDYAAEVICDGRHIPPEMIRLLVKCKPGGKAMLTSDATRPTGMPEGAYELGGLPVLVEDGVAMLADRTSFAGSVATADRLVRTAVKTAGLDLVTAVNMLSHHVAKAIGVADQTGELAPGMLADVILFDEDIRVKQVIRGGQPLS